MSAFICGQGKNGVDRIDRIRLVDLGPGMIISLLRISLLGSILFPVQETNHAELMEHEASLSRNAQEEKLSLQQVLKDITQVLVSLPFMVTRLCLTPRQAS